MNTSISELSKYTLRPEESKDYRQIAGLLESAFGGRDEAEIVERIRQSPQYKNELSLISSKGDLIVGYVMLSIVTLHAEKKSYDVLSLAPVAVLPAFQKQGIGASLIEESIRVATERKEPLIVVLGHAEYYPRFGFERASLRGIYPPVEWPDASYMVLALPDYSPEMRGKIVYPPAWLIE
jgi:putative acetyltransferase